MSSKIFMYSFFSRKEIKVLDENIPGFVSIKLVSMDSKQLKVKMTVSVLLQRAINDTRRWIRALSSETISHLKK